MVGCGVVRPGGAGLGLVRQGKVRFIRRDGLKIKQLLQKYWFSILLIVLIITGMITINTLIKDRLGYKYKLKEKDREIIQLKGRIKESQVREMFYIGEAEVWEKKAREKEVLMDRKDIEIANLKHERTQLQAKVELMPLSEVVVRTREIIGCQDVQEQTQGIVFSSSCGKENLKLLEDYRLVEKEALSLSLNYNTCRTALEDKDRAIENLGGVIFEIKNQLFEQKKITIAVEQKFNLCKKEKRKEFWKTLGIGAGVGAGAILVLEFFLKR